MLQSFTQEVERIHYGGSGRDHWVWLDSKGIFIVASAYLSLFDIKFGC